MPKLHATSRAERAGFTLVEVVLSLAVTSVLLGAMGSLVMIASRSVPDRTRATDQTTTAASVLEQMSADLSLALSIVQGTDSMIEFTVPDRDGDGNPEDVLYQWGGPGGTLVRAINGGGKVVLAAPVENFALSYSTVAISTSRANAVANVPEAVVASWPGSAGALSALVLLSTPIDNTLIAQNLRATLPASARSWTITRVQVCAKSDLAGAPGNIIVQIRTTDAAGLPTNTVLASATIAETEFSSLVFGMGEAVFTNAPELSPGQEVAIVLTCSANCPAGSAGYASLAVGRSTPMSTYSNGAWSSTTLNAMPHTVYATATTTSPSVANGKKLVQVGVQLRVGGSANPEVRTTVNLVNTPGAS